MKNKRGVWPEILPDDPHERVEMLKLVLDEEDYQEWLIRPNWHLDNYTPQEIIDRGQGEIVANLVFSMLTGRSS